jgi:FtsZ-interacting cell division protein ZipA
LGVATELDRFCEGVDKLIAINVVAAGQPFPGVRLKALAEEEGLRLGSDGSFHASGDAGRTLYILSNCEPALFTAEGMRDLQTRAVALTFEIPRVSDGGAVFEQMMLFASRLAGTLGGVVVDDDGHQFGAEALGGIRSHIRQFQTSMEKAGIPAGSPLALRLFDE